MISCEFCEISKNTFFDSTPLVAACVKEQENHFSASQFFQSKVRFVVCDIFGEVRSAGERGLWL